MKKIISMLLAAVLLFSCVLIGIPEAQAAETNASLVQKEKVSRTIAVVFDNSGSMYVGVNKLAWCRATYAMEVFASMLNEGDTLLIYPMNPFEIDGKEYSMNAPLKMTDPAKASEIRKSLIHIDGGTHIESIDKAYEGLKSAKGDEKYLIVLSDGATFHENNKSLSKTETQKALDKRFALASNEIRMMYLGIGDANMPSTPNSAIFTAKQAKESTDVLATLTEMCNKIFGRDTLPKANVSGKTVKYDVSMGKLIVFVQGENISDLKLVDSSGKEAGKRVSALQPKYATLGNDYYEKNGANEYDTSLQGMIVTYEDCAAGDYKLEYKGTESSIEVYYEPDVDLQFVFTTKSGKKVDPNALYEGDYKVSFGMLDGKTGKLSESKLLGNPHYEGSYFINGKEQKIVHDGFSGSVDVKLEMGDTFNANLTVTYLSGYSISKDSTDFGWPEDGITVAAKPAGDLSLEISGGQEEYSLQKLEEGEPFIIKVFYQDKQLEGKELEKVTLVPNEDASNAKLVVTLEKDHYKVKLGYKNPDAPQDTVCGECTVPVTASYAAKGSSEANTDGAITYNINDDFSPLQMQLTVSQTYIVIKELQESAPVIANLFFEGAPLNAEQFAATQLIVDCGGINFETTPNEADSSYTIKLLPTDGISEGDYLIKLTAVYTDEIGRETQIEDSVPITLSEMPLWLKWVIRLLILLLIGIILWIILHIKVLPKKAHTTKRLSNMNFDGEDVTQATSFLAEIKKDGARTQAQYGGRRFGLMMDVVPGQESYLYKSQKSRSAEVNPGSVRKFGPAKINEALIGSAKYVADENGKLMPALPNQRPFPLKNGMTIRYSGTISDAGIDKDFEVLSRLNFNKK